MTAEQFIVKWEKEVHDAERNWKYALKMGDQRGIDASAERMRALSEMLDDYKHLEQ